MTPILNAPADGNRNPKMINKMLVFTVVLTGMSLYTYAYKKEPNYLHARLNGAPTKIIISAKDDDGNSISNANIKALMGMEYRKDSYYIKGQTDHAGEFILEGITMGNEILITASKDGYYDARKKLCYTKMGEEYEVKDGKWQPWGMEVSLPLREKRNPVNLVRMHNFVYIPTTNQWFGFGMKEKDWILDGHKGKIADFEAKLIWDGKHVSSSQQTDLFIKFVGEGSGYYSVNWTPGSAFGGVYNAETNRLLQKSFTCMTSKKDGDFSQIGLPKDKIFVARSRCKYNTNGSIQEANYSIFRCCITEGNWGGKAGAFFGYDFNPTPNDTNLEPANMP